MTTAEVYSENFFEQILASIRALQFDFDNLILKAGEPKHVQLLKLSLRAFFNSILKCPFIDKCNSFYIKALWHMHNITCAKLIYAQYNYMDLYPFVLDTNNFEPTFPSCYYREGDFLREFEKLLLRIPMLVKANKSLDNTRPYLRNDILEHLFYLAETEKTHGGNLEKLAIKLMFQVGEYNNSLDKFIDIFLPIDRGDDEDEADASRLSNRLNLQRPKLREVSMFMNQSLCMLAKSRDGNRLLTIHSNQNTVIGKET